MSCKYLLNRGVAFIQLRNIPVNSLNHSTRTDMLRCLERADKDKVDAVVLHGEGKSFCAGADVVEFSRRKHLLQPTLNEVVAVLDSFHIPTIAGIHGFCLGGGMEVAMACHYRVADKVSR